ncbi:hypothetical protein LguiA_026047 [Lonicera macranthoides]
MGITTKFVRVIGIRRQTFEVNSRSSSKDGHFDGCILGFRRSILSKQEVLALEHSRTAGPQLDWLLDEDRELPTASFQLRVRSPKSEFRAKSYDRNTNSAPDVKVLKRGPTHGKDGVLEIWLPVHRPTVKVGCVCEYLIPSSTGIRSRRRRRWGNCVMSSTMRLYFGIWLFEVGISCSFLLRSRGRVRDLRSPLIP